MKKKIALEDFVSCFAAQFEHAESNGISAETEFHQLESWNSMQALIVIAAMDQKFGIGPDGDDIRESKTLHDLYERMKLKLK